MDDQEDQVEVVLPHNALTLPDDDQFLEEEGVSVPQTSYEPELGQMMFGNAYSEFALGKNERQAEEKLYELSEMIGKKNPDVQAHGLLGGEWCYGQDFVNDVFEMRPYWWGDCTCGASSPKHVDDCEQITKRDEWIDRRLDYAAGEPDEFEGRPPDLNKMKEFAEQNPFPSCTCGAEDVWVESATHASDCREVLPNFRCGDLEIRWYKYIGRGMSANRKVTGEELQRVFRRCRQSLR